MARAQENAASQGDTEFITRQFPMLLDVYETLLMNIGLFLEQHHRNEPGREFPALSLSALKEQTREALTDLENFRSQECAEIVESVLSHKLPQDLTDDFREIQRQLKLFEDDNAEALFKELLIKLDKEKGADDAKK